MLCIEELNVKCRYQGGTNYVEGNFLQGFLVALILLLVAIQNGAHFPK